MSDHAQTDGSSVANSKLPEGWHYLKLGTLLSERGYIRGPFGSALKRGELLDSGIPVYEQQNAIYHHREFRYFIDERKHEELKRFTVKPHDIVISCSGTLGKTTIIQEGDPVGIISQALLILRSDPEKIQTKFLNYFLNAREGQYKLLGASHGSVQVNIAKRSEVENIELAVPPIPVQNKIVNILSCLDDKIDLLRRENNTLEEIAQAFFKRWFVEFNFPNDEGKPYRVSRGKMVDSDLGKIPDGWKAGKIGDILELKYGEPLKMEHRSGKGFPVVGSSGFVGEHLEAIVKGPGIVVGRKGTMGSVIWIDTDFYPIDTTFYVVDKLQLGTLYYHLLLLKIQDFQSISSDSAVPGLNRNSAYSLAVTIPPTGVIGKFNSFSSSIYNKMTQNSSQIIKLSQLRDTLLPRLVSGNYFHSHKHE